MFTQKELEILLETMNVVTIKGESAGIFADLQRKIQGLIISTPTPGTPGVIDATGEASASTSI